MANLGSSLLEYFSQLLVMTRDELSTAELVDNVHQRHPTLDLFRDNAQASAGAFVSVDVILKEQGRTQTATDRSGTFNNGVDDDMAGKATFFWPLPIITPTRVPWQELEMNKGNKSRIHDLAQFHLKQAQEDQAKYIANAMHAVASDPVATIDVGGSPSAPAAQAFALDHLVGGYLLSYDAAADEVVVGSLYDDDPRGDASGDNSFSLGGIDVDAADHPWQGVRIETEADETDANFIPIDRALDLLSDEIYTRTRENSPTRVYIAGRKAFNEYERTMRDRVRYSITEPGETRFRELRHEDNIIVRFDPDAPTNRIYALDTETLVFRHLNENWMQVHEAQRVSGSSGASLDYVTPVVTNYLVGTEERRRNGVLIRNY